MGPDILGRRSSVPLLPHVAWPQIAVSGALDILGAQAARMWSCRGSKSFANSP